MITSSSITRFAYESPKVEDLGDLVALTAQSAPPGGLQKPCTTPDGMSGTPTGNMSGGACGVGS